jgi:FkbM family methyltransferase
VVRLGRPLTRAVSESVEAVKRAGRTETAGRAAAAVTVVVGDRLGRLASARAKSFLVTRVLRQPVVFTDRFGLRSVLAPSDPVYETFAAGGYYERAEQAFCAGYLKPGMTAFDVGASQGFYTLLFAKLAGPEHVHAFEPEGGNFGRLRTNLDLNGFEEVHASQLAVVAEPGTLELNVFPPEQYGWHTLGRPSLEVDGKPAEPSSRQQVDGVSLDVYCAEHGVERVDLLKLDVEGAELEALQGAQGLLAELRIGCLLFEVSLAMVEGMSHDPAEIFDLLREAGYAIHELAEDGTLRQAPERPTRHFQNFVALA